jgi:hypothetical protein
VTSEPVCAFLNGGNWDGLTAILPPGRMTYLDYEARIDSEGQLVPHDLEYVEFDWKG